jgi:hypothetical protein
LTLCPFVKAYFEHFKSVLSWLNDYNVKINVKKVFFVKHEVPFLGFILFPEGIHPQREKVHTLHYAPVPTNVTQLKSYLGFLNFDNKFIAMVSDLLHPLYAFMKQNTVWDR